MRSEAKVAKHRHLLSRFLIEGRHSEDNTKGLQQVEEDQRDPPLAYL